MDEQCKKEEERHEHIYIGTTYLYSFIFLAPPMQKYVHGLSPKRGGWKKGKRKKTHTHGCFLCAGLTSFLFIEVRAVVSMHHAVDLAHSLRTQSPSHTMSCPLPSAATSAYACSSVVATFLYLGLQQQLEDRLNEEERERQCIFVARQRTSSLLYTVASCLGCTTVLFLLLFFVFVFSQKGSSSVTDR
jgi:hypothetical protein